MKGLVNLGRKGVSEAIKSDYAKQKIKDVANKYLDQALDSFSSDLSKKLDPFSGKGINKSGSKVTPKPYCGAKKTPKGRYLGDWEECKKQVRYYGLTALDQDILDKWEKERKQKAKQKRKQKTKQKAPTKNK